MITNEQYLNVRYGDQLIEILQDDDSCIFVRKDRGVVIVEKLLLTDELKKEHLRISRKLKLERVKDD